MWYNSFNMFFRETFLHHIGGALTMEKKTQRKRKKVITKKLFYALWEGAEKASTKEEYMRRYSNAAAKELKHAREKGGLKYTEYLFILNECYEKQQLTFREIVDYAHATKAEISKTFCIPIRTVEEWYNGNNRCNSYIRLMILRHYYLFDFGKYIYTETDEEHDELKPKIYNKNDSKDTHKVHELPEEDEQEDDESEFDDIDNYLQSLQKRRQEMRLYENDTARSVLERTSFIDEILNRRKKN